MTRDELLARLDGTEWTDFEVKSAAGGVPQDAFKTVAAMANSGGGWIVFGVSEQGGEYAITGIDDIDRFQNDLLSAIRTGDKVSRPPVVHPRLHRFDEGWVLALRVEEVPRTDKPVRTRVRGRWLAYVRVGAGDHRCRPEEEGRFVRDATEERYDQTPCSDVTIEQLDPDAIGWLRGLIELHRPAAASPGSDTRSWFASTGLMRSDGSLTTAAALLFGQPGVLGSLLPRGIVDLRVMHTPAAAGIPRHRWDDRRFCDGNIVEALRTLFERFHTLCPQPFEMEDEGPFRRARSREEDALREALVNLIAHQDYSEQSRVPTVLWWRDRIHFSNPGDSFVPVELLAGGGHSLLRNPLIARLLRQANLAEQAGTGLPLILATWREAGRQPPEIRNDPGTKLFEIIFPWGPREDARGGVSGGVDGPVDEPVSEPVAAYTSRDEGVGEGVGEGVSEGVSEGVNEGVPGDADGAALSDGGRGAHERKLLSLLAASPGLRTPHLVEQMGLSRATVERVLKSLKTAGRVTFRGAPKTGGYYLTTDRSQEQES